MLSTLYTKIPCLQLQYPGKILKKTIYSNHLLSHVRFNRYYVNGIVTCILNLFFFTPNLNSITGNEWSVTLMEVEKCTVGLF